MQTFLVPFCLVVQLHICVNFVIRGSPGPVQDIEPQVQDIVNEVMTDISVWIMLTYDTNGYRTDDVKPVKYRAELTTNGTNYFVKMKMPSLDGRHDRYFIVKIFKPAHWITITKASLEDVSSSGIHRNTRIKVF